MVSKIQDGGGIGKNKRDSVAAEIFSTKAFRSGVCLLLFASNPMKTMKNPVLLSAALLLLCLASCKKEAAENLSTPAATSTPASPDYVRYVIPRGAHYATNNDLKAVDCTELKFTVRFDSSAIYQTTDPQNQWDINKLYGFSDNSASHHQYSARFGWRWSEDALRLFAYIYNKGIRESKEIAIVAIGKEVQCSIRISPESYLFSVDNKTETLPRLSATPAAKGYKLYPYFGGDEVAPHEVRIWIKEER